MFRILAAHVKLAVALHDLAVRADLFDGTPYFHWNMIVELGFRSLLQPAHDPPPMAVGTQFDEDRIAWQHPDVVDLHLAGKMGQHFLIKAVDLDPEAQARQGFDHFSFNRFPFFHQRCAETARFLIEREVRCRSITIKPMT